MRLDSGSKVRYANEGIENRFLGLLFLICADNLGYPFPLGAKSTKRESILVHWASCQCSHREALAVVGVAS